MQVVTSLKDDSTFIQELFARLRSPSTSDDSKKDLVSIGYIYIYVYMNVYRPMIACPHFAMMFQWTFWRAVEICYSEFLVLNLVFVSFIEYFWYFIPASGLFSA